MKYWIRELENDRTPYELRNNYANMLRDARLQIDDALGKFERTQVFKGRK